MKRPTLCLSGTGKRIHRSGLPNSFARGQRLNGPSRVPLDNDEGDVVKLRLIPHELLQLRQQGLLYATG
jgi:hypothetical protein